MTPSPSGKPPSKTMPEAVALTASEDLASVCTRWAGNVRAVSLLAAANDADRLRHLPVGTRVLRLWRHPCPTDAPPQEAPSNPP